MDPIDRLITPKLSRDVIRLLVKRGWTKARIARTIDASADFVGRVESASQSFTDRDVDALARAAKLDATRLLFEAIGPAAMKSDERELYSSTRELVDRISSGNSARSKPQKKRRAKTHAS